MGPVVRRRRSRKAAPAEVVSTKKPRTRARAPGPGPITSKEWEPTLQENLAGRNIMLHTDGARAYQRNGHQPPWVRHDWVVHAKQRVQTPQGIQIWKRASFQCFLCCFVIPSYLTRCFFQCFLCCFCYKSMLSNVSFVLFAIPFYLNLCFLPTFPLLFLVYLPI